MTFNPNAEIRSDNTRRASGGGGFSGGFGGGGFGGGGRRRGGMIGGGIGGIILLLVLMFMGVDPSVLLGGSGVSPTNTSQSQSDQVLEECQTGEDANTNDDCLVQGTIESANSLWQTAAPEAGIDFRLPQARVFSQQVNTGCGAATSATGPFYCPADETIYVDTTFFDELNSRFGATNGQLAKAYVVAHEYGHHIQAIDGTMTRIDRRSTGPQSDQVRLELQADCYAGMWAHHASTTKDENGNTMLMPLTEKDINDALSAASAVGDDHIQGEVAGGQVQPDTWTHGSSEQRRTWFVRGYQEGTYEACNTFAVNQV